MKTIRAKLALAILLLAIIVIGLLSLLASRTAARVVEEQALAQLQAQVAQAVDMVAATDAALDDGITYLTKVLLAEFSAPFRIETSPASSERSVATLFSGDTQVSGNDKLVDAFLDRTGADVPCSSRTAKTLFAWLPRSRTPRASASWAPT